MTTKKKRGGAAGQTIGSILVGFDQQVFRNLPPAQELVEKSRPARGLSGQDDGLEVVFPDDAGEPSERPAERDPDDTPAP